MKIQFDSPVARRDEPGLLPLVNIVFLLLVFILLAGTVTAPDPLTVRLPVSDAQNPAQAAELKIGLLNDGGLTLDGLRVDAVALDRALKPLAQRVSTDAPPRIRISADRQAVTGDLLDLLAQLSGHGFGQASLIVQRAQ